MLFVYKCSSLEEYFANESLLNSLQLHSRTIEKNMKGFKNKEGKSKFVSGYIN